MKFLIVLVLFLSQAAYADDYYTPQQLKKDVDVDALFFSSPTTLAQGLGYVDGVVNSIKTMQNLGLVPRQLCINGGYNAKAVLNAMDIAPFAATNQGGTMFIYYAMLAKYPC